MRLAVEDGGGAVVPNQLSQTVDQRGSWHWLCARTISLEAKRASAGSHPPVVSQSATSTAHKDSDVKPRWHAQIISKRS